ncbi:pyridoxine biosynthesis 2 isoform X1 [Tasmannia lanceolata]|uniref:pyridoxine biosynthesis 2 isoform X1 n=1 Tax=Tasmannia lanceolata TaxID=3420 RepID=UPI004064448A
MSIGVLALQGSFNEHLAALRRIGVKGVEIRKPEQLQHVIALIIPGGESTTMAKLAECHNLFPALRDFVKTGKPVWGTCAGLIFLANKAVGKPKIWRTGPCWGSRLYCPSKLLWKSVLQLQSFETELSVPELVAKEGGPATFRCVFIRAPAILKAGPDVEVLADYPVPLEKLICSKSVDESQEEKLRSEEKVIIAVKQGNLLATAFHPELTADTRWHSFFLKMVGEAGDQKLNCISTTEGDLSDHQTPNDLPIFQ